MTYVWTVSNLQIKINASILKENSQEEEEEEQKLMISVTFHTEQKQIGSPCLFPQSNPSKLKINEKRRRF